MKNRTWTLIEAITCAVALFILLALPGLVYGAGDMPPEAKAEEAPPDNTLVPQENRLPAIGCDVVNNVCLVNGNDIRVYVARFDRAMKELAALRASKGCAKLEVAPKSRAKELLESRPLERGGKS